MNNIFKKKQVIQLDEEYRLEPDQFKGVILIRKFTEEKTNPKTKEISTVEDKKRRYFPRAAQALEFYFNKTQNKDLRIEAILENTEKAMKVIEKFDKTFNQYV